jgi:hypothetical protein
MTNNSDINNNIAEFEHIFNVKLHDIEKISNLSGIPWTIVWVDKKNAILISSKGLLEFQKWGIFTNRYYILLSDRIISLKN